MRGLFLRTSVYDGNKPRSDRPDVSILRRRAGRTDGTCGSGIRKLRQFELDCGDCPDELHDQLL